MAVSQATPRISRRTLASGVAWSVPGIVMVSTAPVFAASAPPCEFSVDFSANPASSDPATSLVGQSATGEQILISLTSTLSDCTEPTAANLWTRSDRAIGAITNGFDVCREMEQNTGAPAGYVTLNQHAWTDACTRVRDCDPYDGHPSQDLTLTFLRDGVPLTGITGLELDVYDITSVVRDGGAMGYALEHAWVDQYQDMISFNQTPSAIQAFDPYDPNVSYLLEDPSAYESVGDGSYANPFHRAGYYAPTKFGVSVKDTFVFDALTSNSITMRYSNNYYGYQFVALAGIRLTVPC